MRTVADDPAVLKAAEDDAALGRQYLAASIDRYRRVTRWGIQYSSAPIGSDALERFQGMPHVFAFSADPLSAEEQDAALVQAHQVEEYVDLLQLLFLLALETRQALPADVKAVFDRYRGRP